MELCVVDRSSFLLCCAARGDTWTDDEDSKIYGKTSEPLFDILLDEYFYAYAFCKKNSFPPQATSTFLSIYKTVMDADIERAKYRPDMIEDGSPGIDKVCNVKAIAKTLTGLSDPTSQEAAVEMAVSFAYFKSLVMYHSVERCPQHTVAVFTKRQAAASIQYMQSQYYRHFKLFRYNFLPKERVAFHQIDGGTGPCDEVKIARPLCQAHQYGVGMQANLDIMYTDSTDPVTSGSIEDSSDPSCAPSEKDAATAAVPDTAVQPQPPSNPRSTAAMSRPKPRILTGAEKRQKARLQQMRDLRELRKRMKEDMEQQQVAGVSDQGIPKVPWQTKWQGNSKPGEEANVKWSTLDENSSNQLEDAFTACEDREISLTVNNIHCGTKRFFKFRNLMLIDPKSGEEIKLRRDTDEIETLIRMAGRQAKKQAGNAAAIAWEAAIEVRRLADLADASYRAAYSRRCRDSALLKMYLIFKAALKRLNTKLLLRMQARVEQLLGDKAPAITVLLVERQVKMSEQIQFKPGSAEIQEVSQGLMGQIKLALLSIEQTCGEFGVESMYFKIEGHTAVSKKKNNDGGISTSRARAREVCNVLTVGGVDPLQLAGKGYGCHRPPKEGDPRRVEIHVMDDKECAAKRKVNIACAKVRMARLQRRLPMSIVVGTATGVATANRKNSSAKMTLDVDKKRVHGAGLVGGGSTSGRRGSTQNRKQSAAAAASLLV